MNNLPIDVAWLNVNRACNLRCEWCYAKGAKFSSEDDMSFELAEDIISLKSDLGIGKLIFIGGEPLMWDHLFRANMYAHKKGMITALVTNGVLLAEDKIIRKIINSPMDWVNISLKARDTKSYLELTGRNAFGKVVKGMNNLASQKIGFDVSITLNQGMLNDLVDMVRIAFDNGAENIIISFCTTVFSDGEASCANMLKPEKVVDIITSRYEALNAASNGRIVIEQSLPVCLWDHDFLEHLIERNQISFGCHTMQKSGLIFDPNGNIIPCNCLHECKLGRYGKDFNDKGSFKRFWKSKGVNEVYDNIITYPSGKCVTCDKYRMCGGGCPLQWFVFDPEEIIK